MGIKWTKLQKREKLDPCYKRCIIAHRNYLKPSHVVKEREKHEGLYWYNSVSHDWIVVLWCVLHIQDRKGTDRWCNVRHSPCEVIAISYEIGPAYLWREPTWTVWVICSLLFSPENNSFNFKTPILQSNDYFPIQGFYYSWKNLHIMQSCYGFIIIIEQESIITQ